MRQKFISPDLLPYKVLYQPSSYTRASHFTHAGVAASLTDESGLSFSTWLGSLHPVGCLFFLVVLAAMRLAGRSSHSQSVQLGRLRVSFTRLLERLRMMCFVDPTLTETQPWMRTL